MKLPRIRLKLRHAMILVVVAAAAFFLYARGRRAYPEIAMRAEACAIMEADFRARRNRDLGVAVWLYQSAPRPPEMAFEDYVKLHANDAASGEVMRLYRTSEESRLKADAWAKQKSRFRWASWFPWWPVDMSIDFPGD